MPEPNPNPLPSRSPSPSEDIAAAMGFSSFGAKPNPPKKKRKTADPNSEGSGSNNTPLGVRTRKLDGRLGEEVGAGGQGRSDGVGMGMRMGGAQGRDQSYEGLTVSDGLTNLHSEPDPLTAAALDESAAMLLETGLLPQYLDWNKGFAEGGPRVDGRGDVRERGGGLVGGGGASYEMRRQGKRGDGEWDWQALRKGVVDERGDVAFYDGSFVEDPWRGGGEVGG